MTRKSAKKTAKKSEKKKAKREEKAELYVRVTAYRGLICFEPTDREREESITKGWVPVGGSKVGTVLWPSKTRAGVSKEALALLKTIPRGRDAIGDFDWFETFDDKGSTGFAFSWFGPLYRIIDPKTCETARDAQIWEKECVIIPNHPPLALKETIDEKLKEGNRAEA